MKKLIPILVLSLFINSCDNDPFSDCYKKNYKALRSAMEIKLEPTHKGSEKYKMVESNIHAYSEAEASILAKRRCENIK